MIDLNLMIITLNGFALFIKIVKEPHLITFIPIVIQFNLGILSVIYTDEIMSYRFCAVTRINHK